MVKSMTLCLDDRFVIKLNYRKLLEKYNQWYRHSQTFFPGCLGRQHIEEKTGGH